MITGLPKDFDINSNPRFEVEKNPKIDINKRMQEWGNGELSQCFTLEFNKEDPMLIELTMIKGEVR